MCGQCDQLALMDEQEAKSRVIKVVSLWEPWATAMRRKLKKNETRSWRCAHRGWLGIHAAKKEYKPRDYDFEFNQRVQGAGIWPHHLITTYGHLLCIVKMVGCEKTERVRDRISEQERFWGNYDDKRYAWITSPLDLIELEKPIPLRGHQGLFEWQMPEEIAALTTSTQIVGRDPNEPRSGDGL